MTRHTPTLWKSGFVLGFAAFLTLVPAAGWAQEEDGETRIKVRQFAKAVIVNDDGEVIEWTSDGSEGDGENVFFHSADGDDHEVVIDMLKGEGENFFFHAGGGYLGVELLGLTEPLREHFGVPSESGIMVSRVVDDSPAFVAGIEVGDILTLIDGKEIHTVSSLTRALSEKSEGDLVDLELWRGGSLEQMTVAVGERREANVFKFRTGTAPFALRGFGDGDEDVVIHIDTAVEKLQEYFEGDEWKDRVKRFESMEWKTIEERMREAERRLRELEAELDEDND